MTLCMKKDGSSDKGKFFNSMLRNGILMVSANSTICNLLIAIVDILKEFLISTLSNISTKHYSTIALSTKRYSTKH